MAIIHVLTGPSGSGKTSLGKLLREAGYEELVSHTTRPMRHGEQQHVHYHFVSPREFKETNLVESVCYSGNYYGLSVEEFKSKLESEHPNFAVLERQGAQALLDKFPGEVRLYFIQVNPNVLEERMRQRGDEEAAIQSRLEILNRQREWVPPFEVDAIISNDGTLEEAWAQLKRALHA